MNTESPTREYRQTARAKAAEETGKRITAAFRAAVEASWFDEVRLEDVAREAGVTVQTVIRRFGSKEGLLEATAEEMDAEILGPRRLATHDIGAAVDAIIREYEAVGELIMRLLAQEDRYPAIRQLTDRGRATHRAWVGEAFAPWLDRFDGTERRTAHDRLVIALDLYIWKLLRVDMKRSKAELRRTMLDMAAFALGTTTEILLQPRHPESPDA